MCGAFRSFCSLPSFPTLCFPLYYQCDGFLSYLGRGGSLLGCQVLPAISAVSILELVANSGSSRISQAPNQLRRLTKLHEPVGRVQFGVFENFTSAYLFQTAQEKSCDYLLIIDMKKFRDG